MRKVTILSLLLAFTTTTFCQQATQKPTFVPTDYLQKSKKQKKTATILLAVGAGLVITAFVIPKGDPTGVQIGPGGFYDGHKNDGIKGAFILAGGLSMLGSIPFFIASGKNKRRAGKGSVFINIEKTPALQGTTFRNQSIPVIGISLSL